MTASSYLKDKAIKKHVAESAHDFRKNTAWVEGKDGYGIGEYLDYTFNFNHFPDYAGGIGINGLMIMNGYRKSKKTYYENSKVKRLKMYVNGKPFVVIKLIDTTMAQIIDLPKLVTFPANKDTIIRFEIVATYPGTKYKDTAITEINFRGPSH